MSHKLSNCDSPTQLAGVPSWPPAAEMTTTQSWPAISFRRPKQNSDRSMRRIHRLNICRSQIRPRLPQRLHQSARAQRMTSLSQAWQLAPNQPTEAPRYRDLANVYSDRSRQTADQEPTLASMGSVRNMGDGIGSFSQASPEDAALAATDSARQ